MKNLFKYTFAALFAVFAMTACTDEYEYTPASAEEQGGNAYMTAETTAFTFIPGEEQNITVTVHRIDTTKAETIKLTCDNEKFTVPETVEFAANEKAKDIAIVGHVETGGSEKVNIALDPENAFLYAGTSVTVSVNVYRTFAGMMASSFFSEPYEVDIYELAVGEYMIPDAYDYGYNLKFSIDFKTNVSTFAAQYIFVYSEDYGRVVFNAAKGTYDPENKLVTVETKMTLPDAGLAFSGTFKEQIMFLDDPQQ